MVVVFCSSFNVSRCFFFLKRKFASVFFECFFVQLKSFTLKVIQNRSHIMNRIKEKLQSIVSYGFAAVTEDRKFR